MMAASCSTMAIPSLSTSIPLTYRITSAGGLTAPLTIALLEANVISDAMLRHPRMAGGMTLAEIFNNDDARELSMRALSKWWSNLVKNNSCKFFRWNLHVQSLDVGDIDPSDRGKAWFIFTRQDGELPRFAIGAKLEKLEATLPGFGQTVLAVLKDASLLLPDCVAPWQAAEFADCIHWGSSTTDEEMLEEHREMNGYASIQQVREECDLLTRARFYEHMPRWATNPKRVASRDAMVAVASNVHERAVIAACDAIAELASKPRFFLQAHERGAHRCGQYPFEASMALLWKEADLVGAVIDDHINDLFNSGEGTEFIDANPVAMTARGIQEFQEDMEHMMQLAVLTERLVLLVGERL